MLLRFNRSENCWNRSYPRDFRTIWRFFAPIGDFWDTNYLRYKSAPVIKYARRVTEANNLTDMFTVVHGANDVPAPKPSGEGLLMCCKEIGLEPHEVPLRARVSWQNQKSIPKRSKRFKTCKAFQSFPKHSKTQKAHAMLAAKPSTLGALFRGLERWNSLAHSFSQCFCCKQVD